MTTIAYRDNQMATDSRAYSGVGSMPIGSKNKLHRISDGTLLGVSTTRPGLSELVVEYFQACIDDPDKEHEQPAVDKHHLILLLVKPNGDVFFACDSLMLSGPIEAEYFAIGSGCDYAMGAMAMGAKPAVAVATAIKHDVYSGYPIRTTKLGGKKVKVHDVQV